MHMLEDHVVPSFGSGELGLGFMESRGLSPAAFNWITRPYTSIPDRLMRLKCVMREHQFQISTAMVSQEPTVKKR